MIILDHQGNNVVKLNGKWILQQTLGKTIHRLLISNKSNMSVQSLHELDPHHQLFPQQIHNHLQLPICILFLPFMHQALLMLKSLFLHLILVNTLLFLQLFFTLPLFLQLFFHQYNRWMSTNFHIHSFKELL